ncbi:zinc-dependent alcohol dehydrogenase family protein [Antarctobacter jejuensis]|uniref:zinc-dependent alcohol dehydrogenase family protein n=1 Tax=Antarctobacter jejuensis TaxID=1439938 RepID=UPI003FD10ACF
MKAMIYEAFGAAPKVTTLPDPTPSPDGVVLKVEATGLCRSDWHGWMGHDPDIDLPHVPGHELAGTIAAVGPRVTRWKEGDRVTVPFICACGSCPQCHAGHQQVCDFQFQPGFTHWGSYAEFVALPHADLNLIALPESMGFDTAASLGCRFATSFRAVVDQGRVSGGEWVAVHGCGGVGLSAIMIARAMGAQVVAVDIDAAKLDMARSIGATGLVDARAGNVPEAVHDLTGGGAHLSIDALGHPETCANSILSLRKRGRHVQVGLLLADQSRPPLPMDRVIGWELEIYGSHGMQAHRYGAMLTMIQSGALSPDQLVGDRISLDEAVPALMAMDSFQNSGATVITRF